MDRLGDYHTKWRKSDRERQTSYDITYLWNLKYYTKEFICDTEIDSHRRQICCLYIQLSHFALQQKSTPHCKSSISPVQSLSHLPLFVTSWTAAHQASLSFTNFQSLLKLMSIESGMPSNHLILCRPLLLLPSIFPSIRVFSVKSVLHIRWPK